VAATAVLALIAAETQALLRPDTISVVAYLGIWITTATLSLVLTAPHMYARSRRIHHGMSDEMIEMAVEQFLPALGAGFLTTVVVFRYAQGSAWMLPGIWQLIVSLGVFSSCRFLPRLMPIAGAWYMFTGLVCIGLGSRALSPWAMGVPFAVGQGLVAAVLRFSKEKGEYAN
jgi:hypothetical protein